MTAPDPSPRARLARRLREVRAAAYPSGNSFAPVIGWQQSRVSKIERGAQLPTEQDIAQWVEAADAGSTTEAELREMLEAARVEYATHRDIAQRGGGLEAQQATYAGQEAAASRIVEYRPAMMPGLVQTPAYGRELMALSFTARSDDEIERVVAARMRRQEVLYDPSRRIQIVIGEAALRTTPGSLETLLGQLDRLTSVAGLSHVQLGLLPFPRMPIMPLAGFSLRDRVASVETVTGEQQLYDPTEVDTYERAFEKAQAATLTGQEAIALIHQVADQLRANTSH